MPVIFDIHLFPAIVSGLCFGGGCNSVVECQLPKLKVASSNLVSRSNNFNPLVF